MDIQARAIASCILNSFERHIFIFSRETALAKSRFEQGDWHLVHQVARERTDYYDLRVQETRQKLKHDFAINKLDEVQWREVKGIYINFLQDHPQAELAESFYNSVFCQLFHRRYYNNEFIFFHSTLRQRQGANQLFTRYQLKANKSYKTILAIIENAGFSTPFPQLKREIAQLMQQFSAQSGISLNANEQLTLDIVDAVFYRNKGAYLIGRLVNKNQQTPFIVAITHDLATGLHIDALITSQEHMAVIFGFARAYFFVDCQYPSALVDFLQQMMPHKTRAELYSSIGFHKQGKTQFYRDFFDHLNRSDDQFVLAQGIKGMVMSVFTLPSYPYVFKIIKDEFSPSKNITKEQVKAKYRLVKLHDRVGRMADTLEYSQVAFPKARFSQSLLQELRDVAPSIVTVENDQVVIEHLYIERRMTPLNLYLADANAQQIEQAMFGYGQAIKQLIAANIFPGDMLLKNFGVTRHGRVIFYDYDEISYMNQVCFKDKPIPQNDEQRYASEPWYTVEPGDVFPEELGTFALANPQYKSAFLTHHSELLSSKYWQQIQQQVAQGIINDIFPYPEELRFCHLDEQ